MTIQPKADVLIAGGGPSGLMLAIELGRRGISVILVDEKPGTALNPQANATQARTMEHYRRLGFAEDVRALGLPADYPTDIAYYTRFTTHELGRFRLPSARSAQQQVKMLSGSWSAAELPHRVSQKFVETVLRKQAEVLDGVSINYGVRLSTFAQDDGGVSAEIENADGSNHRSIRSAYLVACDGARSPIRNALGIEHQGDTGVVRDFFGGRMHAIYLRAPKFYDQVPHDPAWMNVTFNADRRAFMAAVDGKEEFAFHTQLRDGEDENSLTEGQSKAMFNQAAGAEMDIEIISRGNWTAGLATVSDSFQADRVFIAGDAAHLFTPAGGLGYNTAVEDAVNLGWKLAAVLKGNGGERLLDSYETERRPLAQRNTSYAREFAESLGLYTAPPALEDDSKAGAAAREASGAYLAEHGRKEFNIPGITFGGRYDGSPVIIGDGTPPPNDVANSYEPTASPGGRPPHLWLEGGQSLYDRFGFGWTLLKVGPCSTDAFANRAKEIDIDLTIADVPSDEARDIYQADLALIRPDQIVAWRGNESNANPEEIFDHVLARDTP